MIGSLTEITWLGDIALRLLAAAILGGLVGYERERANHPAGFRTHILVSLGSALVMVTAEFIYRSYNGQASFDPTRLGAQVISGIGFLGAGAIIRTGSSVKGLTTAASLWVVACIGLACGSGFYWGALLASLFVFLTLIALKKIEKHLAGKQGDLSLLINLSQYGQDVQDILRIAAEMQITVRKMQLVPSDADETGHIVLKLDLHQVSPEIKAHFFQAIHQLPTVLNIIDE